MIFVNEFKEGKISFADENMREFPLDIVKLLWNECIAHLDLSGNKLSNFEFLRGFIHLKSLILDGNEKIGGEGLSTLPPMPNLELFYSNNCKIPFPANFAFHLSSLLASIKYLSIMEKSTDVVDERKSHRLRMFVILMNPFLLHFNDKAVRDEERRHAESYHQYLGTIDCTFSARALISSKDLHKVMGLSCQTEKRETSIEIQDFIERKLIEDEIENQEMRLKKCFKNILKKFELF